MDNMKEFFTTLAGEAHVEFEEKRSIFIGHALRTDTEEEAQEYIKKIKKQYKILLFYAVILYIVPADIEVPALLGGERIDINTVLHSRPGSVGNGRIKCRKFYAGGVYSGDRVAPASVSSLRVFFLHFG